jgi:hypothetical protein
MDTVKFQIESIGNYFLIFLLFSKQKTAASIRDFTVAYFKLVMKLEASDIYIYIHTSCTVVCRLLIYFLTSHTLGF